MKNMQLRRKQPMVSRQDRCRSAKDSKHSACCNFDGEEAVKTKAWSFQWLPIATMCILSLTSWSQQVVSPEASSFGSVPNLVHYSGSLTDGRGKPLSGIVGITFSLYKDSQGGAPLWTETQTVQPEKNGHYSVMLGSATTEGLPSTLFTSAEARWLGVQVQGYEEQPRVLLLSVPYALKAGDAATIGGLPPSAFMLAAPTSDPSGNSNGQSSNISAATVVNGAGTTDFIPLWTSAQFLGNSALFQSGSGSSALIGINTNTPAATLDVNGGVTARGALQLPSTGTATASQGFNSQPLAATTSVFDSSTQTSVPQNFQWQAEPSGNNTGNPGGTLNLLFAQGSGKPAETGLNIASNGLITFAAGQTFPGAGNGTITGVTAGTDLTGGGSNGNVTLNVDTTQVVTGVTAGTDLTGGGTGGVQTLNLDTTKVPQLSTNNSFSGEVGIGAPANLNNWAPLALGSANGFGTWLTLANTSTGGHTWNILSAGAGNAEGAGNLGITDLTGKSTIWLEGNTNTSNLTATGTVSGATVNTNTSYNLGTYPIITANLSIFNQFFGFEVGNAGMTGANNFGAGIQALWQNTTGAENTALGEFSLYANSTGNQNTAAGDAALGANTTGSVNTALGSFALSGNTTASNNTAVGSFAMYLNTTGSGNTALGTIALSSPGVGNDNTAVGYAALNANQGSSYESALGFEAGTDVHFPNLTNATALGAFADVTESNALVLGSIQGVNGASSNTQVGIGTTAPTQSLEVDFGNELVRGTNNFQKNGDTAYLFLGDTNNFIQSTFGTGLTLGTFSVPTAVRINQYSGFVGIGTTVLTNRLTLGQGTGAAVGDGWNTYSSRRWKTHIQTLDGALAKVELLRGVSYDLKESGKHEIGVIAEEIGQVVPEVVTYEDNGKDARSVDYSRLTALLIEAVKQQQRQIRTQQTQIRAQQQQILQLNNKVGVLETASRVGSESRLASVANAIGPTTFNRTNEQQLRTVRRQLHQLRTKDSRVEDRLARLERDLKDLNSQSATVALAEMQK